MMPFQPEPARMIYACRENGKLSVVCWRVGNVESEAYQTAMPKRARLERPNERFQNVPIPRDAFTHASSI